MRIAMISQVYPPMVSGASIVVHGLANSMAARGHDVLVVSSSDEGPPYSEYRGRLEIVRVRSQANPARAGARLALFATKSVEEALEEHRPEVIHLHDPSAMGVWSLRYAEENAVPAVYSCHALPPLLSAYTGGGEVIRSVVEYALWRYGEWFINRCDRTIVPTKTIARVLYAHTGCSAQVISGGVDTTLFTPRPASSHERAHTLEKYGIEADGPVILHVGRLDVEKKVALVVKAAAAVSAVTGSRLVVVGDGTERPMLAELAAEMGIGDRVVFTGLLDRTGDLPALYRLADVFVSACDIETQGLVLLEAMASGVPAVAVRAGGVPDVVRDGVTGFLARPGSAEALAEGILRVLRDPGMAAKLSKNARDLVEAHSLETTFDLYESVYAKLVRQGREAQHHAGIERAF